MTSPPTMLVTGAAAGLGAAIATAAANAGYRVGVLDIDYPRAQQLALQLDNAVALQARVDDEAEVEKAMATFGAPDVLVNNAGIVRFGPLLSLPAQDWRAAVEVNLTGTFLVARAAARLMATGAGGRGGTIINVTSMNGVAAGPNAGAYGSTKAGVALLTQQMALEWGSEGIRVNAVAPGLIDGGMSEPIYADPATRQARESKVPVGRLGTPEDIANVVLFLASDAASYINGQNILIDGGVTMGMIANLPRPASVDSVGHADPESDPA